MRPMLILSMLLLASTAYAQRSAVPSNQAGNIVSGSPELANQLPTPQSAGGSVVSLLDDASTALKAGHTGEAQEALEEAETQALDRSVPYNDYKQAIAGPVVSAISQARQALGMKDIPGALRAVAAARAAAQGG